MFCILRRARSDPRRPWKLRFLSSLRRAETGVEGRGNSGTAPIKVAAPAARAAPLGGSGPVEGSAAAAEAAAVAVAALFPARSSERGPGCAR